MSRRINILHIISSWESGVGNELAAFAARLAADGFDGEFENEICVLANSTIHRQTPNVPTTTLGMRWSFDVSTYLGVRRIIRRFRPDVIHVWDNTSQMYASQMYIAPHHGTQRIIAERRDTDIPAGMLQKHIDKKTHRFIVPRNLAPWHLAPWKGGDCPKTVVIPPAAVPAPYSAPMPAEELLEKLDIPMVQPSGDYYPVFQSQYEPERRNYKPIPTHSTPFLIGVVLPLCSEHRILDALWVFETMSHVHLNYHAFFIGDGKDSEECLRYRDRWKLFSRVHFFGNHRFGNQCTVHRLLPSCDVLLHLSPSAEHSGTILSAMSYGVPVIALETPESREYISDGTTGLLVPCNGDFRFYRRTTAKKLLYLLENTELRRSMQSASKERVAREYNFDTAVQKRVELYRQIHK